MDGISGMGSLAVLNQFGRFGFVLPLPSAILRRTGQRHNTVFCSPGFSAVIDIINHLDSLDEVSAVQIAALEFVCAFITVCFRIVVHCYIYQPDNLIILIQ